MPSSPVVSEQLEPWSSEQSISLYKIYDWGAPYFSVNDDGNISVRPHGDKTTPQQEIDLMEVVQRASDTKSNGGHDLQFPLIVRFPDVLKNRLESLNAAFVSAIKSGGYKGRYQGVYPVKCNQDCNIVEDIIEFGSSSRFGLEAGSKPELLLAMSCLIKGTPRALLICNGDEGEDDRPFLICNGYKDEDYISLALFARSLGLNTVIVLEQEDELDTVIRVSQKLGIRPVIGFRAKLRTKHSGHFGSTSGENGKFGLTTSQILSVARKLKDVNKLDCLQLLHFHIGSQIPYTSFLHDGVVEAAQIYCELTRLGAAMKVIDIGGGLGIDYDGSKSGGSDMSVSYGLNEYAVAVVQAIQMVCDQKDVKHPIICSESGRALVSHHSVLVFEALSATPPVANPQTSSGANFAVLEELKGDTRAMYHELKASADCGDSESCGLYADQLKRRCMEQFKDGFLSLEHLAATDGLCEQLGMSESVKTYNVNLSIFSSIPDHWAFKQLFPIIPIHRLNERPTVKGILSDLTCDSDGMVAKFIGGHSSLPLHEIRGEDSSLPSHEIKGEDDPKYFLGMFLGGAYQEALGSLHNLFGGPSVVRVVQSDGPHSFAVTGAIPGLSCADVLRAMRHEREVMFEALRHRADECPNVGDDILHALSNTFDSMPYLVSANARSLAVLLGSEGIAP